MLKTIQAVAFAVTAGATLFGGFTTAEAADPFYLGTWKITEAVVAPWLPAGQTADAAESQTLLGKTITLSATAVDGPGDFPCKAPQYQVIEGGAEMLFQGTFGEMHDQDKTIDPQQLADQVGFAGDRFRTVITGCAYEVDFSFGADADTAKFGLNNYVYTMKRE
jgi:hypothetical protein